MSELGSERSILRDGKVFPSLLRPTGETRTVGLEVDLGFSDIRTCINVHDAIEQEFGCDINDRATLISDFEMAYYIVMQSHDAI